MSSRIERFGKEKKRASVKNLRIVLVILFSAVFAYCGFVVISYLIDGYQNTQLIESIREKMPSAASGSNSLAFAPQPSSATSPVDISAANSAAANTEYQSLLQINPDAVGWISIAGMNIDYPVARSQDNEYYLDHNFALQQSSHGCLFMDYRNKGDATDSHIIIYGHNMRDGSMFGQLSQYKDLSFFQSHPTITVNLRGVATTWQVFSACTVNDDALPVGFESNTDLAGYALALQLASLYNTGITVGADDQILTLSTCSHDYNNSRFVVHAKKTVSK